METFVQPNPVGIWGGVKMFSWDKIPELLKHYYEIITKSMDKDADIAIINTFGYHQAWDTWFGIEILRHAKHTDLNTWPKYFQPFDKTEGIPHTINIGIKPLSNITIEMAESTPEGDRNIYGTLTYHPSIAADQKILDLFFEEANPVKNMSEFLPVAVLQPMSRTVISKMKKRGGNALGIVDHDTKGPLTIFSVAWKWKHASDDERSYAAYYRFMEKAEAAVQEMGVWHPYKYINYAEATQDVWSGYGEKSLKELRRVQREVDPEGVFARGGLGGGYFKLNELPEKKRKESKENLKENSEAKNNAAKSEL
jgi:FAD/FMN-containing dehydrogenase